MLEQLVNSTNFDYLSRGMAAASLRQEVISHNIANVNTPNFRRSVIEFEDLLAREIYGDEPEEGKLQMVRTNDNHLPHKPLDYHAEPNMMQDTTTIMRVDDNNVDIDIEMATLAKNQLYFNALATQLNGYISKVKNVMSSNGQ
ncbi:MAG: flagellar basal body rod protein FlgB [Selenomonadaceae bacterium]|nr:flagellar basal body rod protein FlgB [Selenomonadaceae bacterium]